VITIAEKKDASIPSVILKLPEMANILLGQDGNADMNEPSTSVGLSEGASTIMLSAARFQSQASGTRLTQRPVGGSQNSTFGSAVSKARSIKLDRQQKRKEFQNKDTSIHVAATLWSLDDNQKMTQVRFYYY